MLILNETYQPIRWLASFLFCHSERAGEATILRFCGRLMAYVPQHERAYYAWVLSVVYRPAQRLSERQFSPSHLRVCVWGRFEFGVVLGHWLLGLRLGEPLVWLRRTAETLVTALP
ncbi:MAG: hypothetical protein GX657_00790 [Chloroflexi bacterium]|nr:hypothetical protein [Chloroflexota bacterium]